MLGVGRRFDVDGVRYGASVWGAGFFFQVNMRL